MSKRIPQVNQLIKKELSNIILKEIDFPPDILVTLTRVDTAPNLQESKVYVSVMPEGKLDHVFNQLNRQIYNLQQFLNRRLRMRPIPKVIFQKEKQTVQAGKIEEILERLKNDKN